MLDYALALVGFDDSPDLRYFYCPYRYARHGTLNRAWDAFQQLQYNYEILSGDAFPEIR